mmetsp:Transcript_70455/g.166054  ORF Transcript_70455/g.166054 Transcript_70455/m.166054 type:complete len:278 (+) Transcript_70455:260-1093(+)
MPSGAIASTSTPPGTDLLDSTTASAPKACLTRARASRDVGALNLRTFMKPPAAPPQGRRRPTAGAARPFEHRGASGRASDDGADANRVGFGDLAVAQHLQPRCGALEQPGHRGADQVGHQQRGRHAAVLLLLRGLGGALGQGVGHARVQRGAMRRVQGLGNQAFELGLQRNDVQLLGGAVDLLHDGRGDVGADAAGKLGRVRHGGSVLGDGLDDGAHVADVDALLQQQLEHALQGGDADHLRDHVFDQLRRLFGEVVHERLRLHTAQELGRMHLHQV